jgi:putative redox protein
MTSKLFEFRGAEGHQLTGRLELPEGPAFASALFAHCFTCSKDSLAAVRVARALAAAGIAVLRFDFTGLGDSDGSFGERGFSGDVRDLVAAARAMADAGAAPQLLVGHSLGAAAILAAAGELPDVAAIATIAAPFDVEHITGHFREALGEIAERGRAEVTLGGRPFTIGKAFVDDLARHDQAERIAALGRPLLILHSPVDQVVGIENATRIYGAARHPKSFVSLDGADHLLTRQPDAEFAARVIAAWASRYLPKASALELPGSERRVVAQPTGEGRFQTRIEVRGGAIYADEPVEVGGLDTGPTPYELLCAALAACTAMTMRLYAEGKKWELPPLRVKVAHAALPQQPPRDRFTREILFDGPLDAERRARLLEIADRCPVHRTLERSSEVVTIESDMAPPEIAAEPASQHLEDMDELSRDAAE